MADERLTRYIRFSNQVKRLLRIFIQINRIDSDYREEKFCVAVNDGSQAVV